MVFEAKLPAVQSPVTMQGTKQAHPAVLIPNQPEQAEATKLPSQDVCDAASVDPIQTSAVQALGVDRQTHEQPAGLVHDSAAPLAAEANQETIEAASERSADGPPDETIEGSLTSAYPVDTDANPVAAEDPVEEPGDTQPPLPHVARTPVGLEKPNGANGQTAAVTTRAARSPCTEPAHSALCAQPANEAASAASPAFDPKSHGGVSNSATPTTAEAAQRLTTFTNEVQIKRRSPLIRSPPKQKPPVPQRSRRIAAQQMGHIPASKRVRSYSRKDGIRTATCSASGVAALLRLALRFQHLSEPRCRVRRVVPSRQDTGW